MSSQSPATLYRNAPTWCVSIDNSIKFFVITLCAKNSLNTAISYTQQLITKADCSLHELSLVNANVCQIKFQANNNQAWLLFQQLLQKLENVDVVVQPASWLSKKLLICDMDKTIVDAETLDEVAEYVGIGPQVAKITEQAMRGEIDFHGALHERINLLKGQPQQVFLDVLQNCPINKGAEILINKAKKHGITTILISGGFAEIAYPISSQLGFDRVYCNQLDIENNILTGNVIEPIVDAQFKRSTLLQCMQEFAVTTSECCAIGDGANDIPMLQTAGLGIAYEGKPLTREATPNQINVTDLETAAYFMGLD